METSGRNWEVYEVDHKAGGKGALHKDSIGSGGAGWLVVVVVVEVVEVSNVRGGVWTRMRDMGPRTMGAAGYAYSRYVLSMMERCRDDQDEDAINFPPNKIPSS